MSRLIGYGVIFLVILIGALALFPAPGHRTLYMVNLDASYHVMGEPTISASFIDALLCKYHSPACRQGQTMYSDGKLYHVDPVYAIAFYLNESTFGTKGVARYSLSIGNLRCMPDARCVGGYAYYPSWEAGIRAWYRLITGPLYIGAGLTTVDQIIPRYAPNSDNNDEAHYIAVVKAAVSLWRAGKVEIP